MEGPATENMSNTYSVTVVATDATRRESAKAVTVSVTNVDEPGTVKLTTLQPRAGIALTASVSDPDGPATVTGPVWQWAKSRSRTSGWGDIDRATSATYTPADTDAGYYLRAMVTYKDRESVKDTKTAVGVSANQVKATRSQNDAPVFPDQDPDIDGDQSDTADRTVTENTAAGEAIGDPIVAEDDDGDVLTYTLYDVDVDDGDSALFAIDWATGQLKTKGKLDFEAVPDVAIDGEQVKAYVVIVRATDPDGMPEVATADEANSDVITVTIMVTDVNEAPVVTGDAAVSFEETADIGELGDNYMADDPETDDPPTLALTGADRGKFNFENGELRFKAAPDYEKPGDADKDNVYEVTVEATDGVGNTGTKNVKVTVTNMEEEGTVTMSQLQPRVGVALTASVTDLDGDVSGVTWQWSRDMADTGTFTDIIAKATSATYKPVKADADPTRMFLRATAMYTDGHGETKTAMGESANAVDEDTRNRPPAFDDQDDDTKGVQNDETTRSVAENTKAASPSDDAADATDVVTDNVGSPVTASDPDPNADALVYTLEGADAASFTVRQDDPATTDDDQDEGGQIEVGAGTKLDYETKQTYTLTVRAADSFGESNTIVVTIMVTPVDEAPEIMRAPDANVAPEFTSATTSRTVAENMVAGEDIGNPVAANDANGDALTYALRGTDAASFAIDSARGQLMTKVDLDFETKDSYEVTVTATDPDGASDMITVSITVTNVEEMGRVTFWRDGADATTAAIMVGDELGGAVDDSDGNPGDPFPIAMYTRIANVTSWQWARSMDMTDWEEIGTGGMYTVMDADEGYHLRATAMYDDGEGMGKMASEETMMVMMTMNTAPMFASETATREVAENTAAGMNIGAPVTATDADSDTLIYTLGGTDAASFDIGSATGQLMTKEALDYETKSSYEVMVTATDPDSASDMITVTITVTNEEEMGEVTLSTMQTVVGTEITATLTDPDDSITGTTWQWAKASSRNGSYSNIEDATSMSYTPVAGDIGSYLRATAMYTDGEDSDKSAMGDSDNMVTAEAGDTLVDRYDLNNNGIEKTEVLKAINDYLFPEGGEAISKPEVLRLINLYLFPEDNNADN